MFLLLQLGENKELEGLLNSVKAIHKHTFVKHERLKLVDFAIYFVQPN